MAELRFTAYDLRTRAKLAELPVQTWDSTDELSKPGTWSAQIPADATVMASTMKGRSEIVAERDGVPLFSGVVWGRKYDARTRMVSVAGRGLLSYFEHFVPSAGVDYSTDQFGIVRALVASVQSGPGGDIGVQVTPGNSGVSRDRTYERFAGLKFGELIENLSNVQNGFDIAGRVEYNAGQVERWVRLWYPRRGREQAATNLRFRAPGNSVLFDMAEDGTDMAMQVHALGAGDGADMLITSASRTDLVDAGWPGYTTQRSWKDVTQIATLGSHAQAAVDRLSGVDDETFNVQVDPNYPGQPWGGWDLGDDCMLIVDDDPAYPAQVDGSPGLVKSRRVMSHRWTITGSSEQLVVGLGKKVIP